MDPRKPEIWDNGVECGRLAAILGCIASAAVAALLIVGWIWLTGLQTFGGV